MTHEGKHEVIDSDGKTAASVNDAEDMIYNGGFNKGNGDSSRFLQFEPLDSQVLRPINL